MSNRLIDETSPYLLQHANNPVNWYPWGPEALERAKANDIPILLSVGYSACHWCHVMERESFENQDIARQMNESFVNIKVDREERPDVDSVYMTAVQALTGRGGWPMTVFLTPEGKPFYGGTYYPPSDRPGLPGFSRVLDAMSTAYRENRGDVTQMTKRLLDQMQVSSAFPARSVQAPSPMNLSQAFTSLVAEFDDKHGGLGIEPKFPQPMIYEFLLKYYVRTGDPKALRIVEMTLDKMAMGGIYDQLGGGFHRYSTDTFWLVPHFEKMLYDNALLVKLYLHTYQVTHKPLYKRVVEETLDYVLREMTDSCGGFYSSQDADSEGEEGKYFIWRPEEVVQVLGPKDARLVNSYFGITDVGNFEGRTILHISEEESTFAGHCKISQEDLAELINRSKTKLMKRRELRIKPGLDNKVITSWNGLMLGALAEAASVLNRSDYAEAATKNATFLLNSLMKDGRLLRSYKDGEAKLKGYLEDYAFLASGLMSLHEATFNEHWLREAISLTKDMLTLFGEVSPPSFLSTTDSCSPPIVLDIGPESHLREKELLGVFYDTASDHEKLVVRPRDISDNAIPSGSSMATDVLLRIGLMTDDPKMRHYAKASLQSVAPLLERAPIGAGQWLSTLDFYLSTPKEIVIIGDPSAPRTRALINETYHHYIPNRILVGHSGENNLPTDLPLFAARDTFDGTPIAYVCENYTCNLPVTTPADLAVQLE